MSDHGQPPPPPPGWPPPPAQSHLPPSQHVAPGQPPPPPGAWPGGPPGFPPTPPGYTPPPKKRPAGPWVLGVLGVIVVSLIVAAEVIIGVGPCQWVDSENIVLDITNDSSKQSSYAIDVNFRGADGARVGDEPFFVDYVRAGERTIETAYVFDSAGGVDCEIAEVQRFESHSADDLDEVTCEPSGVDFVDDISSVFVATNGSSETSDYFATAALMRDGIRIGTASASIEKVRSGESAPGDGFSIVDGPDTGVECEVVDVSRASSE